MMKSPSDYLLDLLEEVGRQLVELDMYAVDQFDMKALAMISIYCRNLGSQIFNTKDLCYDLFLS